MAKSRKAMSGVAHGVPEAQEVPGELSDGELVIAAARHDRERQRSGRAMRVQAVVVMVLAAVACWLVLVLGRIPYVGYIGIGMAIVVAALAAAFLSGLIAVSPIVPWGIPVRGACPVCGGRRLRENRAVHWEDPGAGGRTVDGIVTLCMTDGCDYAAVRKVRQWPGGRA